MTITEIPRSAGPDGLPFDALPDETRRKLDVVKGYLTTRWQEARQNRASLKQLLLDLSGFEAEAAFIKAVSSSTACFTVVAGLNTRWTDSIDTPEGQRVTGRLKVFSRSDPRFLAKVPNLLPADIVPGENIPAGLYNLYALVGLGRHIIIHSPGNRERIEAEMVKPLRIEEGKVSYREQPIPEGGNKPLGHGDALIKIIDVLPGYKYLIANFGNDANSRQTAVMSLLTMYVMDKYGEDVAMIMPTANMEKPKYPVVLDSNGFPIAFGQAKLLGEASVKLDAGPSNIGVRVYKVSDLLPIAQAIQTRYQVHGSYALMFGRAVNECAQDDFDRILASTNNRVRHLCVANEAEINHSAKTVAEIPYFLNTMAQVLEENGIPTPQVDWIQYFSGDSS